METFQPSIYLAMFPYLFIASFPIFGLVLVTRWTYVLEERKDQSLDNQIENLLLYYLLHV